MNRREPDPQPSRSTIKDAVNWAHLPWDTRCTIHPKFFLNDGTLMLRVEDSLYQVYRHTFEHESPFFRTIFASLKPSDSTSLPEGSSPIAAACIRSRRLLYLPHITTVDFDRLLSVLYPRLTRINNAHHADPNPDPDLDLDDNNNNNSLFAQHDLTSTEEWTSVLSLSYKLVLDKAYNIAVRHIAQTASAVDKAVLGKQFGIKSWVATSYRELCERRKPLTVEEGSRLGLDVVIRIYQFKHDMAEGYRYSYEVEKYFELDELEEGVAEVNVEDYIDAVLDANS
ncbi:hypothetical protein APHAL10511_005487 [Amanita phalloides]|nr:hypothetical protein APHAL10511_005487 [Amanita phalloides]